jgi:ketosteroid isomerase-like protein
MSDRDIMRRAMDRGATYEEADAAAEQHADARMRLTREDALAAGYRTMTTHYRVEFKARPVLLEMEFCSHSYVVEADSLAGAVFAARQLASKRGLMTGAITHAAPVDPSVSSDWGRLTL